MSATFASTPATLVPSRRGRPAGLVVVVPGRLAAPRPAEPPTHPVYIRRRVVVAAVFLLVAVSAWFGAGKVLANRGGAPASTPTVRTGATYVAQPGDTMWSIAQPLHGGQSTSWYVDALVELNGGTSLQVGQVVQLP